MATIDIHDVLDEEVHELAKTIPLHHYTKKEEKFVAPVSFNDKRMYVYDVLTEYAGSRLRQT